MARLGRSFPINRLYRRPVLTTPPPPAGFAHSYGTIIGWLLILAPLMAARGHM